MKASWTRGPATYATAAVRIHGIRHGDCSPGKAHEELVKLMVSAKGGKIQQEAKR